GSRRAAWVRPLSLKMMAWKRSPLRTASSIKRTPSIASEPSLVGSPWANALRNSFTREFCRLVTWRRRVVTSFSTVIGHSIILANGVRIFVPAGLFLVVFLRESTSFIAEYRSSFDTGNHQDQP